MDDTMPAQSTFLKMLYISYSAKLWRVNFWQMKLEDGNILAVECNAGYCVM